ncbi:hypothetical protein [Gluconobacter oxydans]|uniref:hypothetical protein n=1 Tax=Gluconobacter oxydans TaxID=442 RepID=UPI0039EAD151
MSMSVMAMALGRREDVRALTVMALSSSGHVKKQEPRPAARPAGTPPEGRARGRGQCRTGRFVLQAAFFVKQVSGQPHAGTLAEMEKGVSGATRDRKRTQGSGGGH